MKKRLFLTFVLAALLLPGGRGLPNVQAMNVTSFEVWADDAEGPCNSATFNWQIYASGTDDDVPVSDWYDDLAGVVITDGNGGLLYADDMFRAAGYPGGGSGSSVFGSQLTARPVTVRVYETAGYSPYGRGTWATYNWFIGFSMVYEYSFDPATFVPDCASLPQAGEGDDADGDGVPVSVDNCDAIANPDQADTDGDGLGDACDNDGDNDGLWDAFDNCPAAYNPGQSDSDGDGIGNACDEDYEPVLIFNEILFEFEPSDVGQPTQAGALFTTDLSPDTATCTINFGEGADEQGNIFPYEYTSWVCVGTHTYPQAGSYTVTFTMASSGGLSATGSVTHEVIGQADLDSDGDGVPDDFDNCLAVPNADQADSDGDAQGDVCDICVRDVENDIDGDGVCGNVDNCPYDPNPDQVDFDGDGLGNEGCDYDDDNDGVEDWPDLCPQTPLGTPVDDIGCPDGDGDNVRDEIDNCPAVANPGQEDSDGNGVGDACQDGDGDGVPDASDGCPVDPTKVVPGMCGCGVPDTDSDSDGMPDCLDQCMSDPQKVAPGVCGCGMPDTDSDVDGTPDCLDQCMSDPQKVAPGVCGCGVPDTDSDADGTPDCLDQCMSDPQKAAPGVCGCGVPDTDSDSDGMPDCIDNCPATYNPDQADSDGDGLGNACDAPVAPVFGGFLPPLDGGTVLNAAKAGAAIPVKFSLGGDFGLNILQAWSQQLTCDTAAAVSTDTPTVSAGQSSLSYDAATGQYTYVWKTEKGWAKSCRQLVLQIAGATYTANFSFK